MLARPFPPALGSSAMCYRVHLDHELLHQHRLAKHDSIVVVMASDASHPGKRRLDSAIHNKWVSTHPCSVRTHPCDALTCPCSVPTRPYAAIGGLTRLAPSRLSQHSQSYPVVVMHSFQPLHEHHRYVQATKPHACCIRQAP